MEEIDLNQVNPDIYSDLPSKEREEAIHNLHRYLDVIIRIHERLKAEGKLEETLREIRREKRKGRKQ
jgi:hypothetical protein